MDCLLKALELRPQGPVAATIWSNTAAVAAAGGASEEAAQAARTALALAPTDPETRLNARILAGGPGTHLGIPLPGEKPSMRLFFEA
ncbi:unnamed protein product [Polarella glacialis]|uniref:Uncharacterized protein n=1 Tax=Polarella glacialis TaxID=89957 RepID=A0A813HG38_POLGL|nr:unnamed protein product [Polarella glacialis]